MTLDELKESLINKRFLNRPVISEFNELKRNSELLNQLMERFSFLKEVNYGQLLYHLREELDVQLCECGIQKKFRKFDKGYFTTCGSQECKNRSRFINLKKNNLEKYGVEHTSQLESTKNKHKETMLEKYGCEHNFTGELRKKTYSKNLEKYGVKHALQRKECIDKRNETMINNHGTLNMLHGEKARETNLLRYNTETPASSDKIKNKIKESSRISKLKKQIAKLEKFNITIVRYISEKQYYQVICNKCKSNQTLAGCTLNSKLRMNIDPCTVCNPHIPSYSSNLENELRDWIISLGEKVINNSKTVVSNSELDIYLPDRGIGFEFNGLYWHSELYKEPKYHQEKSREFLKNGVKIYHIWEDDWKFKKEKVKSRILNLLNRNERIYARKCEIRQISGELAKRFFELNHLDETFNAKKYFGAFYRDELVSAMSFSKSRFDKSGDWEIIRFANLSGKSVIGVASRLLKAFILNEMPNRIITYAKIDWTPDPSISVYSKIGFNLIGETSPGKYWISDGLRHNRMNFTKKKLVLAGENKMLTADEIMHSKNKYKIFDSGNWKFELIIK